MTATFQPQPDQFQGTSGATAGPVGVAALSEQSFSQFSDFIRRELGIKMPPEKRPMLQCRLQRRLRQLELRTLEEYQHHLFASPHSDTERLEFINLVTTNKTDFFREPRHFDYLVRSALPILAPPSGRAWELKLWCAGCSSGEEPYTLAMVLSEYRCGRPEFGFHIFATDISTRVLDQARLAIYEDPKIEPVPLVLRQRYLLRSKDRHRRLVRVAPELRQKVRLARLNFMDADYGLREQFDVIFFRNVMIYFDKPTQQRVLERLCRQLRPGGYLFVGHSESLVGLELPVRPVATSVFQKAA